MRNLLSNELLRDYIVAQPGPAAQSFASNSFRAMLAVRVLDFEMRTALLKHHHLQLRRSIHALRRLPEILRFGVIDIAERLRIAIHQREPRALHVHHDPMPASEGVLE